ncbi:phosphatase, partial [Streptomyces sp. RP5T]
MTVPPDVWKIASVADAARARAAVGRLAADGGTPVLERARFLTALTARLRDCVGGAGAWELRLHVRQSGPGQPGRLEVSLSPAGAGEPDTQALSCSLPHPPARGSRRTASAVPQALLCADEDTAAVLGLLDEQENLVRLHREELHHTNQGVLALHADLEAAARAQRELLEAERTARTAAERARRLLTFLGDASAAITSSLSHTAILRRLSDMLVPEYAERLDVWLFDEEEYEERPDDEPSHHVREHSAAAVAAART